MVALALALADRRPRGGLAAHLLALAVGFTNFTNSVEGQTALLGIAAAVVFSVWGLLTRDGMGRLLLTAFGFSGLLFLVFGLWQGGFPEFSELGWIIPESPSHYEVDASRRGRWRRRGAGGRR